MEGGERPRDFYTSSTSSPLRLIMSTLLFFLQISLCSRASAQDGQIKCDVLPAKLHGNTSLTCYFPEDVSKTRTDFSVYLYTDKNSPDTTSSCHVTSVKENEPTTFTCTFSVDLGVTRQNIKVIHQSTTVSASTTPVGTIIAVTVVVIIVRLVTVTLIIAFILRKRRSRKPSEEKILGEGQPMIQTPQQEVDKTTKNFLADLSKDFRKIYPEYNTKAYVVPSLYFNDVTYEVNHFAGEDVYITRPPDQQTVKRDMAMRRVLTSLHLLANFGKKVMFVISQFDYDKYLANPRKEFTNHNLPRPGELRKDDKHYGDFDILIIHRHHGLVVGVVKTCSGGGHNQRVEDTPQTVVEELKQGCKQLDEAEKMLQHLLSDRIRSQNQQMKVKKLLILPNLWEEILWDVLRKKENKNVAENLKKCLGLPETADISKKCLCGDHMWRPNRPQKIKDWFSRRFSDFSRDKTFTSDDEYADIVARFCGPATISSSNHQSGILPKTMEDWVWMTGELFNKPILHPQQWQILNTNSPLVFLSGPPASGKTRMLVLAGKRWMSEGHKVHVVSTGRKSRAASHVIYTELWTASKEKGISGSCELITFETENMKEMINKLSKLAKPVYIIADEAYNAERSSFQNFIDGLLKKVPKLHLWAASCLPDIAPQCCEHQVFKDSFTCPPAILARKDVSKLASDNAVATWRYDSRTTAPTDGPPVMVVNHDGEGHNGDYPHDCKTCADKAMAILQTLNIIKPVGADQKVEGQAKLLSKDILVLCENDGETAVSAALKKSGVSVKTVDEQNREQVFEANNNEVWEAKGKHVFGIKRKVVVYVEGKPKGKHKMSVDLRRLRGVTSATSQLIWLTGRRKSKKTSAQKMYLSN